jgi:hypothetical protein
MNMTDFARYLFNGTSFADLPWTNWTMPCCSTFFMNSDLILRHPREDYITLLNRMHTMATFGYCKMFQRRACIDNASAISGTPDHWNYIVGCVLERAWGPMFTGLPDQEWNMTSLGVVEAVN